jgi:hypothetical protein
VRGGHGALRVVTKDVSLESGASIAFQLRSASVQSLFVNSNVGTSYLNVVDDPTRTNLGCATHAEVTSAYFVPVDGVVYKKLGNGNRCGLAHVRVNAQVEDMLKMIEWVKNGQQVNVYLVGGFKLQPGPADAIVKALSGKVYGYAWGIDEIYEHIKKPNSQLAGSQDATGHLPAFLASVNDNPNDYLVGTATLVGCVGVLVAQVACQVNVKKVHLYDCQHTVQQANAFGGNNLRIVNAF